MGSKTLKLFYLSLLVAAALALVSAHYASNAAGPSATLSVTVVPAQQQQPPPSSGNAPADVAAAGFTTQVLNADFSQPSYTNLANWLDGCGGPESGDRWVYRYYYTATQNAPCGQVNLETDGTIGKQVLHTQFVVGEEPSGGFLGLSWPDYYQNNNIHLPMGYYTEITFRIASASLSQPSNVDVVNYFRGGGISNNWFEPDYLEVESATNSGGTWLVGDSGLEWCNGQICGGIAGGGLTDAVRSNVTAYHTYGVLFTTDTTSQIWKCSYLDGVKQACAGDTGLNNPSVLTSHTGDLLLVWGANSGNFGTISNNVDVYIQSIRAWTCPGALGTSTQCTGPLITQ